MRPAPAVCEAVPTWRVCLSSVSADSLVTTGLLGCRTDRDEDSGLALWAHVSGSSVNKTQASQDGQVTGSHLLEWKGRFRDSEWGPWSPGKLRVTWI